MFFICAFGCKVVFNRSSKGNVRHFLWFCLFVEAAKIPGGGYSLIWAIRGRAARFDLAVLNRVYNSTCFCPKQGMVLRY